MPVIAGTSGNDTLTGTALDDQLFANGGIDLLLGGGGADTYQLRFSHYAHSAVTPFYTINETSGGDGSIDTITGVGSLIQSADFADFTRIGNAGQTLLIHTAYKPYYFHTAGVEAGTIKIVNQHSTIFPGAQVEKLVSGSLEYNLLTTDIGTGFRDILTGWKHADTFHAGDGDDYVSGGSGRDTLFGEGGNDVIFGGNGADKMDGGTGNDRLFGANGRDKISGGDGDDQIDGGAGRNLLRGDAGNDILTGGDTKDRLFGGIGDDTLTGGAGNDRLTGNKGGDVYVIASVGSGNDTIIENGGAPLVVGKFYASGADEIQLSGFNSLSDALHGLGLAISGNNLILSYQDISNAPGVTNQITIQNHFASARYAVELVSLGNSPAYHLANLSGDNFTYSTNIGPDAGGEDMVLGTSGNDQIFGGTGNDILFGAGGNDVFIFHDEGANWGGNDIILDFNPLNDKLDYTEIQSLGRAGVTVADNSFGNAVVSSAYGTIELAGVSAAEVTDAIFNFF